MIHRFLDFSNAVSVDKVDKKTKSYFMDFVKCCHKSMSIVYVSSFND